MKNHRKSMTWKDVKGLLGYAVGTVCGLLVKDSIWLENLRVELGESVVNGICIVVMILISVVLLVILNAIDKIIEKKRP
ncbi:MAG: hypothetical protein IJ448_05170 [Oscillospiraceae bacterium]|nr:hypothetical protein [Oscillospiraceae bacterium]